MDLLGSARKGFANCGFSEDITDRANHYLEQWLTKPEFSAYFPQLEWLIETEQWPALMDRFYQILPFGTGGRRGAVGIGPNRMNLWTLGASVQGHCEYLKEQFPGNMELHVVVAYDVRKFEDQNKQYNPDLPNPVLHLSSLDFARHAVGVYAANGIHSYILPSGSERYLATPELSYAIRVLKAHGGLNISASHNPPDDNGGKFYDERGAQPVPPEDQIMAEIVDQVNIIHQMSWSEAQRSAKVHPLTESIHHSYIELCRRQSLVDTPRFDEVRLVFTPLHGVGAMTAMETLREAGFRPIPVESQMEPNGQFPNVTKSPNPEVPDSMDRALELAKETRAHLLLATDPDADRVGGMAPRRLDSDDWYYINGNEIAALLTHFKLKQMQLQGRLPASPIIIKTLVTTSMVSRIARHFGAQLVDNLLVGCKYIGDVMWHLEKNGSFEDVSGNPSDVVLGCEESHGYLLTPEIRDKDAAASSLLLAEIALESIRRGETVVDYLDRLAMEFGYFKNLLTTMVLPGLEGKQLMAKMLDGLRNSPPPSIGGLKVTNFIDLRHEDSWMGPIKGATDYSARNFLVLYLGNNARIALRPSGTEPKAKVYTEVCCDPKPANQSLSDWQNTCKNVDQMAQRLTEEFMRIASTYAGISRTGG